MRKQRRGEKRHGSPYSRDRAPNGVSSHPTSINPIKSKIRDVTRLLGNSDHLPADIRIEKERALAGYKQDLETALREKQKQHMIGKYHMVRFFERQKATRNLKKLKTQHNMATPGTPEYQRLQNSIQQAEVDLKYTIYYPLTEKYLSIFPRGGGHESTRPHSDSFNGAAANTNPSRPFMWTVVEQCMHEGMLEALRDGKLSSKYTAAAAETPKAVSTEHKIQKNPRISFTAKAGGKPQPSTGNDSDSDGDFFEP